VWKFVNFNLRATFLKGVNVIFFVSFQPILLNVDIHHFPKTSIKLCEFNSLSSLFTWQFNFMDKIDVMS